MANLSEENATGLNPEEAYRNIHDFCNSALSCYVSFSRAVKNLYRELYYVWASPNAVEFNKYREQANYVLGHILDMSHLIESNAIRNYNVMANANGAPMIGEDRLDNLYYDPSYRDDDITYGFGTLVDNQSGIVGMNILQTQDIVSSFDSNIEEVLSMFDALPDKIALFDTNDNLKEAFKSEVTKMKSEVSELVSSMDAEIKNAIETETNNLRLASNPSSGINA